MNIPKFVQCNINNCDEKFPYAWRNGYFVPKEHVYMLVEKNILSIVTLHKFVCKRCKYGLQIYSFIHEAEYCEVICVRDKSGYLYEWNLSDLEDINEI